MLLIHYDCFTTKHDAADFFAQYADLYFYGLHIGAAALFLIQPDSGVAATANMLNLKTN